MTLTATRPATSASPGGRELWHRFRVPVALLVVLLLTLVVLGALGSTARGSLDPRSFSPGGARAVAVLLEQQGVQTIVVEDLEQLAAMAGPTSTVFVPQTSVLFSGELARIDAITDRADAALVVAGADDSDLQELDLAARALGSAQVRTREPACRLDVAQSAGAALTGGVVYAGGVDYAGGGTGCYPAGGDPTLLVLADGQLTLLGSAALLTNDHLDEEGNAALALNLLAARQSGSASTEVLWLLPREDRAVPPDATRTLADLVPDSLIWGVLQVGVAIVVLALWRSRRLGRVVPEALPVVVRGAETVEGRSRLYRAAGARDQAAEALRAGARDRLAGALGLTPDAGRASLVETLCTRTGGDAQQIDRLLFGPAPTDDDDLVRLADDLDRLQP